MNGSTVQTVILALLSAGGGAFIWTLAKSILAFRDSAEGREDKAVARLETYEKDCREQLAHERLWGAYWQRKSAILEHALLINGIDVPDAGAPPEQPEH